MEEDLKDIIENITWSFLRILSTSKGQPGDKSGKVEFVADYYRDGYLHEMHEHSRFKLYSGAWKYVDDKG